MNSFKHYSSIENSYKQPVIDYFSNFTTPDTVWCATEKIHGSNFSATTDGTTIKWGKRGSFLNDSQLSTFHSSHKIKEKYDESVIKAFNHINNKFSSEKLIKIHIFGEICGGKYHGFKNTGKAVQKEVSYCPHIEFIVFDIFASFENNDTDNNSTYQTFLDTSTVVECCESSQLLHVPIMRTGTLTELISMNPTFLSHVYTMFDELDLPLLPNNYAEGYVLKPMEEVHTPRGRVILKFKSPRFSEKDTPKSKPKNNSTKVSHESNVQSLDDETQSILDRCYEYINDNRKNSVLSKLTENEKLNNTKIIGLIVRDAFEDILKDFEPNSVIKKKRSIITPHMMNYAKEICNL
ncbi:hypothetical protein OAA60_05980 [Porticoccaceae bacterium]|jgi:Rnl2 family RNA ligase|nr:hypothetical protein [Porticoccaceae bacterium]